MTGRRSFGTLSLSGDAWVVGDVQPHVAIRLKQIFPRIAKASTAPFILARGLATDADLAWFAQRYPMSMSAADKAALEGGDAAYAELQRQMDEIQLPAYEPPPFSSLKAGMAPRHYQAQAVDLAYASRGLLLGDDCGLGKTVVGICLCLRKGTSPAAVVAQGHIQKQWGDKFAEFTDLSVHLVETRTPYRLPPSDVYVFRYSQLSGWVDLMATGFFRAAIFDEPQELRTGSKSQKGQAAEKLADSAGWRLGLSATPIYGFGAEIFNVMRCIDRGVLGSHHDFMREWTGWNGRLVDPAALGTYLREQHTFLRRTKAEVGREMPAINRVIDYVDYDQAKVASIEQLARTLAIRATTGTFVERGNAARELDLRVRHATGVAKAAAVADYVRIIVEGGEPVLVVGWHRDVYEIWLDRLKDLKPAMYTGSEGPAQKRQAAEAFVSGATDIMLMSLRAAAGLDGLQGRCSTVVFGELDWSAGIHHQVIERLNRDGQAKPVMALFLVANDGSDPPMMELLALKSFEAHQVVSPGQDGLPANDDHSHLGTLVARYIARAGTTAA